MIRRPPRSTQSRSSAASDVYKRQGINAEYMGKGNMNAIGSFDDILKEGALQKQSKFWKEWRRRWFVLTPSCLYSFKDEKNYKEPTEIIPLKDCTTVKSADDETRKEHSFRIDCKDRSFFVVASSQAEKESWIGAIGIHSSK
eukprot:TRINITY_DN909_c0_g1_i10.p1 TRINITY_DN909_c0_g1~~TRINITY_DN909_c0_g1_i10.p1  ORF type:complete len:142 (-),score=26.36 TRINITY_DN909_c0_g1_i10:45-470(-)